jgi:hypothetical protein
MSRSLFFAILTMALAGPSFPDRTVAAPTEKTGIPPFVQWIDPTEKAFTVDVPQGWAIIGGTRWQGPTAARGFVTAESPGGRIHVFLDDPDIVGRQVPHPMYAQLGWREGARVTAPSGDPLLIARFETGEQFAQHYIGVKLCPRPEMTRIAPLQEDSRRISTEIAPYARAMNAIAQASVGEASFRCGGKEGYTYATTVLVGPPTPGGVQIWGVYKLAGYTVSDPSAHEMARYVMNKMLASLVIDKAWEAQYQRKVQDTTGNIIRMQNALTQEVLRRAKQDADESLARLNHPNPGVQGLGRNKDSDDRLSKQRSETILGQKRVCDDIGRCETVDSSHDHYWMDHSGRTVPGPASGGPPDNSGVWRRAQ